MLNEVLIAGVGTLGTFAAAVLGTELAELCALDVAAVGDGDDHVIVSIEVLGIEIAGGIVDVGAADVAELVAYLNELLTDHVATHTLVGEDKLQTCYLSLQGLEVGLEFVLLQAGEPAVCRHRGAF